MAEITICFRSYTGKTKVYVIWMSEPPGFRSKTELYIIRELYMYAMHVYIKYKYISSMYAFDGGSITCI